jgi:arylsulfatase A-like enzyme
MQPLPEIAGAALPSDRVMDGVNLMPYISGENQRDPHEQLFWRQGHYQAVLSNGWKLQVAQRPDKVWLFNLDEDPTEQVNLVDKRPDKVEVLKRLLATHNADQAEPLWPSNFEGPVSIDKTLDQPESPDDEYIYWPN